MKTVKILSLILAILMLSFCFVACGGDDDPADTTTPITNPDEGKIKVDINVYITYEWDEENEEYKTVKSPILLSSDGGTAVAPGCSVTDALKTLATLRGATLNVSDSGSVDSIKVDTDEYKWGEKIESERISTDGTKKFYDLVVWRWYLNGTLVKDSSSVALAEGDQLELRLEMDTESELFFDTIG